MSLSEGDNDSDLLRSVLAEVAKLPSSSLRHLSTVLPAFHNLPSAGSPPPPWLTAAVEQSQQSVKSSEIAARLSAAPNGGQTQSTRRQTDTHAHTHTDKQDGGYVPSLLSTGKAADTPRITGTRASTPLLSPPSLPVSGTGSGSGSGTGSGSVSASTKTTEQGDSDGYVPSLLTPRSTDPQSSGNNRKASLAKRRTSRPRMLDDLGVLNGDTASQAAQEDVPLVRTRSEERLATPRSPLADTKKPTAAEAPAASPPRRFPSRRQSSRQKSRQGGGGGGGEGKSSIDPGFHLDGTSPPAANPSPASASASASASAPTERKKLRGRGKSASFRTDVVPDTDNADSSPASTPADHSSAASSPVVVETGHVPRVVVANQAKPPVPSAVRGPSAQRSLEKSWDSLDRFAKTNRGRLSLFAQAKAQMEAEAEAEAKAKATTTATGTAGGSTSSTAAAPPAPSSSSPTAAQPVAPDPSLALLTVPETNDEAEDAPTPTAGDSPAPSPAATSAATSAAPAPAPRHLSLPPSATDPTHNNDDADVNDTDNLVHDAEKMLLNVSGSSHVSAGSFADTTTAADLSAIIAGNDLEELMEELSVVDVSMCNIPTCPSGRQLTLTIFSTWGDPHYVGLAGIEFFDVSGSKLTFSSPKSAVTADPPDINVLSEYDSDPRVVANLLDGVNHTSDDLHVWLAPFTPGAVVTVTFRFDDPTTLSLVRIWNYNKSRIHSYRGVRRVAMSLDSTPVFEGEIRKAPGHVAAIEECSEVVLFTTDEEVLALIEAHDTVIKEDGPDETASVVAQVMKEVEAARPRTAGGSTLRRTRAPVPDLSFEQMRALEGREDAAALADAARPMTCAQPGARPTTPPPAGPARSKSSAVLNTSVPPPPPATASRRRVTTRPYADVGGEVVLAALPTGRHLHFNFVDTWGDPYYAALTGLEVLVATPASGIATVGTVEALSLDMSMLSAKPADINVDGHTGDDRTLDKLINGNNVTMLDVNMWMIPFDAGGRHTLDVDLGGTKHVYGVRVWNYNKSPEDVTRGVRTFTLAVDNTKVFGGPEDDASALLVLRPAPGNTLLDFRQDFVFGMGAAPAGRAFLQPATPTAALHPPAIVAQSGRSTLTRAGFVYVSPSLAQDYETPTFPCGMLFKLVFRSSCGDPYYMGLDALGLFDAAGKRIPIHPSQVFASPGSVNELAGGSGSPDADVRVPGNLALEYTPTKWTPADAWLSPLAHSLRPGDPNVLYIAFHQAVTLGMLKVWNYSRTPSRGASSVELWIDGLLVHSGDLAPAPARGANRPATILFSAEPGLVARERPNVPYCGTREQDVMCVDENRVVVASRAAHTADPTAEGVKADPASRPITSVVGK